jgi:hypothetical protein
MSYSMIKRPVVAVGTMDPISCFSRGGMPMPTPVPWGSVDIDCQLPGEPPQAPACRSYGGMWYRELGICVPGGLIPAFPATPTAPAPPANPYDQVAAQVCTLTGGSYANGLCNYAQLGVTRTRSQLVDSDFTPPAGWAPPAGGCPQGQIGWPPVCVSVPNTLPSGPTGTACPEGKVWDAQSGKCLDKGQVLPPGEEPPQQQPTTPAESKLPSWVIPAVAGGAAFLIIAALAVRQPRQMAANAGEPGMPSERMLAAYEYAKEAHKRAVSSKKHGTLRESADLYSKAGRAYGDAADMAYREWPVMSTSFNNLSVRLSGIAANLHRKAYDQGHSGPYGMRPNKGTQQEADSWAAEADWKMEAASQAVENGLRSAAELYYSANSLYALAANSETNPAKAKRYRELTKRSLLMANEVMKNVAMRPNRQRRRKS